MQQAAKGAAEGESSERAKHGCEGSSTPNDGWRQAWQKISPLKLEHGKSRFAATARRYNNVTTLPRYNGNMLEKADGWVGWLAGWLTGWLVSTRACPVHMPTVASKSLSVTPLVHTIASRPKAGIPLQTAARLYPSPVVGLSELQHCASCFSKSNALSFSVRQRRYFRDRPFINAPAAA
ncbi:hypothetical protein AOQ84DRAFT_134615 [Glonium stellatum]|uniref:Uncharacterized protein n=1 Tax=Glonium stellatum TaxID=574774 RepID=A0A8E2ES24_9PEZI|nr:hypothetical protein AOQ84DRAFT_134615 [Glonium stellatum]